MFTSTNVPGFDYPDTGELQPYTTRLDFTTSTWTYIISPTMTLDVAIQRGGYWWPSASHTNDIRRVDRNSGFTDGHWGTVYRRPIRWQWPVNFSWFTNAGQVSNEIKVGYMS